MRRGLWGTRTGVEERSWCRSMRPWYRGYRVKDGDVGRFVQRVGELSKKVKL